MPIVFNAKADNGITVGYHKAVKLEIDLATDMARVSVSSYTNEEAYSDNLPIAWMWNVSVPASLLVGAGTINDALEIALTTVVGSPFLNGEVTASQPVSIDHLKRKKILEINRARLVANRSLFSFSGKAIACDELSRSDIDAVNGVVTLVGVVPISEWKAQDNTYVSIPDKATWVSFYMAMVEQGSSNFAHAQALKAQLAAATTLEEIAAITWNP